MSDDFHTPIMTGAPANAATFNAPLAELDDAIGDLAGSLPSENENLKAWVEGAAYETLTVTRDSDGVVSSATVQFPDGSGGTFTTTTKNPTWLAIDAYTVTHTASGKTITQDAVTRNVNGEITVKPALTVA